MAKQKTGIKGKYSLVQQYLLAGAGLGFYFGYFFRPAREPNFAVAVSLALLAAAVVTILGLFKKPRLPLVELGKTAVSTFIKFGLFMALLEGRHYAYDLGGKWVVTLFATLLGGFTGWWLAHRET
jgi:hypothetical protein